MLFASRGGQPEQKASESSRTLAAAPAAAVEPPALARQRSLSPAGGGPSASSPRRASGKVGPLQAKAAATEFVLCISGSIDGAKVGAVGYGPLAVSYAFHSATPDWTLVHGSIQGCSQYSHPQIGGSILGSVAGVHTDDLVWNLPIGLTYRSSNPHGWPRLILTIEGDDWLGRRVVVGYAVVTVPTSPGRHVRTSFVYRPCNSNWQSRVMGWLMGSPPRLKDPRVLAGNDGRDVLRVSSSGLEVSVTFNIALKDVEGTEYHFA
ncbi:B9 domain-containing protein 1 [Perkinsus chesapeaki]|uniref:B9 domain-containing protein 1 n=1 Tax=Perkinsus chesapeaki TaxID=330153 RepID=A0A7J6L3Y8_PERCH|nr:B9 domain-containing protein 1 [Perkinsus chesapeaki]